MQILAQNLKNKREIDLSHYKAHYHDSWGLEFNSTDEWISIELLTALVMRVIFIVYHMKVHGTSYSINKRGFNQPTDKNVGTEYRGTKKYKLQDIQRMRTVTMVENV